MNDGTELQPAVISRVRAVEVFEGKGPLQILWLDALGGDAALSHRAARIAIRLAKHANKHGECFPGIESIAAWAGCGHSTIKRALTELVGAGWLLRDRRYQQSSVTYLSVPQVVADGFTLRSHADPSVNPTLRSHADPTVRSHADPTESSSLYPIVETHPKPKRVCIEAGCADAPMLDVAGMPYPRCTTHGAMHLGRLGLTSQRSARRGPTDRDNAERNHRDAVRFGDPCNIDCVVCAEAGIIS